MTTVEFENPHEFVAELSKDRRSLDRRIVRVTQHTRASPAGRVLMVSVVGTAHVGADIYRVESVCGILCGIDGNDWRVIRKLHKQLKGLRNRCVGLGLDVRGGVLEENIE